MLGEALDFLVNVIQVIVNILTFGVYNDFNDLLPHVEPVLQATIVGWVVVTVKWIITAFLLWKISSWVLSKLRMDRLAIGEFVLPALSIVALTIFVSTIIKPESWIILLWAVIAFILGFGCYYLSLKTGFAYKLDTIALPTIVTAVIVLTLIMFVHSPSEDVQISDTRFTAWGYALTNTTNIDYTPSLLSPLIDVVSIPIEGVNETANTMKSGIPTQIPGLTINTTNRILFGLIPTIESTTWEVPDGFKLLAYIGLIAVCGGIIRWVHPWFGLIFLFIIIAIALGIERASISAIILIIGMAVSTYFILTLPKLEKIEFLMTVPLGIMIVCVLYLINPPKLLLLPGLIVAFSLFTFIFFYLFGLLLVALGALRGSRSKLGMKKKPTKEVEEYYGSYDAVVVSLILTTIFTGTVVAFGVTLFGLGVFLGLTIAIFKL